MQKTYLKFLVASVVIVSILTYSLTYNQSVNIQQNELKDTQYPEQKGDVEQYTEEIVNKCEYNAHCALNELQQLSLKEEKGAVLQTFDELMRKYDETNTYCHDNAHHLSMFLYSYTSNLSEALSYADQKCGGAVYHGIMIDYLTKASNGGIEIDISKLCPENEENPYALSRWECLHGIGHGLTVSYDYDVIIAVTRCDELEPGWEQVSCAKGVFMENVVHYKETESGAFDSNDILFPCNKVDARYAPACYHYHSTYILEKKYDFRATFKECDKINPEEFIRYCYYGMGRQMLSYAYNDVELVEWNCRLGQEQYRTFCLQGFVMALADHKGIDEAFEFCKSLPQKFKTDCYAGMGKWAIMLRTQEGVSGECSKAESLEYYNVCMKASLNDIKLL